MLIGDGVRLVKFWLDISRKEKAARLEARRTDPLKTLKISPLDAVAQAKWDDYSRARDEMLIGTHSADSPWVIIHTDKKAKARTVIMRYLLHVLAPAEVMQSIPKPDPGVLFTFDVAALSDGRLER